MAGLTSSTRRSILKSVATAPFLAPVCLAEAKISDNLLPLIKQYVKSFDSGSDDSFNEAEHSQVTKALNNWHGPAPTRASACAALELAMLECRDYANSPTADAMINAALRFIEAG